MNNIIKYPVSEEVDFINDVGLTGQDHDNYAEPGTHPRYDWMRMIILGLLANQASREEPTEYRPGTLHYNLNDFFYKCMKDANFEDLAKCIKITKSLYEWAAEIEEKRKRFIQSGVFSGIAHAKSNVINIPRNLQNISKLPNKPYLFKNGKIVNPSLVRFNTSCPVAIELSGNASLNAEDIFTVFIKQ
jgi:hypothetical protein